MRAVAGLIFLLVISFLNGVKGQVTELHNFPYEVTLFKTSQGVWYAETIRFNDMQMSVFNSDFSHYMDIILPYKANEINYISDKLFNSDVKLEYYMAYNIEQGYQKAGIFNEDGEMLYDFGGYTAIHHDIVMQENKKPLLVLWTTVNEVTESKIYELPGNYLQVNEVQKPAIGLPYPNPSDKIIEIPVKISNSADLTFSVYNSGGVLIHQKILDPTEQKVQVETAGLKPGVYIYTGCGVSGKFVVK